MPTPNDRIERLIPIMLVSPEGEARGVHVDMLTGAFLCWRQALHLNQTRLQGAVMLVWANSMERYYRTL